MTLELDREICKKVFGLSHKESLEVLVKDLPEYSTDIKDAWLVVERMKKLGFHFEMGEDSYEASVWRALFTASILPFTTFTEIANTAPLAICNAALQAVAEEEK